MFSKFFIERPIFATVISLIIVIAGLVAMKALPIAQYPTITPVNTFRVVLDEYFGGKYSLVPDVSYYSTSVDNFAFEIIPNTWTGK